MALVFTGVARLTLVANALLLLYSCFAPPLLLLYFNIMHIHIYIYIYIHIYALLLLYSCFTSRYICNCCNPALLEYIHLCSCFTRTLLVLFLLCVCVCRLTGLVECVEESEGLRRDGAWEHGVLQQRPARQVPLHHPPHVSLLMHLAPAQAPTRLRQEREMRRFVFPAEQVRDAWRRRRMSCPLTRPSLCVYCGGGC